MVGETLHRTIVLVALLAVWGLVADGTDQAYAQRRAGTRPDLFYNYYVPPGPMGGAGAELYLCPRPTPPWVGHTYITYPPLMPHEFLHKHCRFYSRRNPKGGRTRTMVVWD
ncbi:MAG: hypothetical protein ACYTG0_13655 [Planctomycetota bacterium]|jgi:hypothetical protein